MAKDQTKSINISDSDLYAFANCIWWVMKEDSLPTDPAKLQSKWEENYPRLGPDRPKDHASP